MRLAREFTQVGRILRADVPWRAQFAGLGWGTTAQPSAWRRRAGRLAVRCFYAVEVLGSEVSKSDDALQHAEGGDQDLVRGGHGGLFWPKPSAAHVRAGAALHADDTTVPGFTPGLGKTRAGRLWVVMSNNAAERAMRPPVLGRGTISSVDPNQPAGLSDRCPRAHRQPSRPSDRCPAPLALDTVAEAAVRPGPPKPQPSVNAHAPTANAPG